jgi:DMSO/TMAO reductase YedYZ heme-binding membrane subunit
MIDIPKVILLFVFAAHDRMLSFLVPRMKAVKILLLMVAHLSLFGIFFSESRKDFGELAGNMLIAILFLSPLSVIIGAPFLRVAMGFRREAGILMAYLAIVHGAGYFLDPIYFDAAILPYLGSDFFAMEPQLLFGIFGIILTFPLLLTSNAFSLRNLGGKNWKRLHMLAYPMFVFVVLHRFSSGNDGELLSGALEAILLIGSYVFLKYLAWKKESFPLLRKPIDRIAGRYKEYQQSKSTKSEALSSK